MSQTSCHEDLSVAEASMLTTDLSSNQKSVSTMDKDDAVGASPHSPSVNSLTNGKGSNSPKRIINIHTKVNNSYDRQSVLFHPYNDSSVTGNGRGRVKVEEELDDPEVLAEISCQWQDTERLMCHKQGMVMKMLELYGIGEGEEDSETEEGQLWRMVQGDAPFTLNLV